MYLRDFNICRKCGDPLESALSENPEETKMVCGRCLSGEFRFEKARSIVLFEGILRDMLHLFKYRGRISIGKKLMGFLHSFLPGDFDEFDIIVPVPVHVNKLKKREFNQSVILARHLSDHMKVDFDPFNLVKTKDTLPQISFSNYSDRKKNVRNTFSIKRKEGLKNRSVLLFNDVFTSGYTTSECSRVLSQNGAGKIQVLTIFRAQA